MQRPFAARGIMITLISITKFTFRNDGNNSNSENRAAGYGTDLKKTPY